MDIANLTQGLATLMWMAALGVLGYVVFNTARGRRLAAGMPLIIIATVLAVALTSVAAGLVFVEPDQRGVVTSALQQGGYRNEPLGPGLHWVIPFAERVHTYSISRQTYTASGAADRSNIPTDDSVRARTKDGQEVFIDASVIFSIDPQKVINLHIAWQRRYDEGVVRPLARGIIRDTAAQYGVEEIVSSKRAELEQKISQELTRRLAENNLLLSDFVLRDIHFSTEYAAAVEQKQIAEQQAQQAFFVVEQRKQEAEQARVTAQGQADAAIIAAEGRARSTVLQAEAEAEALALVSRVLQNNPDLLTFRYIEKLAPNVRVMYLPAGQQYLLPLPEVPDVEATTTTVPTTLP
jgi:regulator of protease activity HflC (stomatin/prohibitin superfamily)